MTVKGSKSTVGPAIPAVINIPPPAVQKQTAPKIETCQVGPFRLPGVRVDVEQYTEQQLTEMTQWVRENGGYGDSGLYSWRDAAKRDWFILRWS
jgi:hypothetical protein